MLAGITEESSIFEEVERMFFEQACGLARDKLREWLERCDDELCLKRDKDKYKVVGAQKTVVKTIMGEVEFVRRRYDKVSPDGSREGLYLLDHVLGIYCIGKISPALAYLIVSKAAQFSFRQTARIVTELTGQRISHGTVWNLVQAVGEEVCRKETIGVRRLQDQMLQGSEIVPILFEEVDGVHISIQERKEQRKGKKKGKLTKEMKVAIAYTGCRCEGNRFRLEGKIAAAGFHGTSEFHKIREGKIRRRYNTDEVIRVLNGDGAAWIRKTYDPDTFYQLDRFHIGQEIIRCIRHKKAAKEIQKLLREMKIPECFAYIEIYRDSVAGEQSEMAQRLLDYLRNNEDGLIPYKKRVGDIPMLREGIIYRNMGAMENNNYAIITRRMKHNRTSWSIKGATNMAKVLTEIENGTLKQTVASCYDYEDTEQLEVCRRMKEEILSAAKAPTKDGKGDIPETVHLPLMDYKRLPTVNAILGRISQWAL